ncbi:MAG TPA: nucleotidyltransferase family protein [Candidatus Nanoarchaeia archaeon]|nr:nucleotidyltransferase family protein [Candidatus Nanoarchaeia archaeon]
MALAGEKIKAIILCAGYATRLYPLTKDRPKPLLEVAGKPIIEHILAKIEELDSVDEIFIVTNNKFEKNFVEWKKTFSSKKKITIINDRTTTNEDRLGSLGDIKYVIRQAKVHDDLLVIAGDNLFEFSLKPMEQQFKKKRKAIVALYDVKNRELAKQYGIVTLDKNNKMISFIEKPENPPSTLSSTGIYFYPKEVIPLLLEYGSHGENTDKAGNFLQDLHKQHDVYCYVTKQRWLDIGSHQQLEEAQTTFKA